MLLAVTSVQSDDLTYDEQDHLNYGIRLLKGNSSRQQPGSDFNTTMPVSMLNALPRAIEQITHPGLNKTDGGESDVNLGRYITILAALLLLAYIFSFGKAIAGHAAGCWAMLLGAIDPNILAHSRLVTTDLFSTLAFVATIYHLHRWLIKKETRHFYYWCIALAIAQCCKINNILLYPVSLVAILAYRYYTKPAFNGKRLLLQALAFLVIHLTIINIAFLFYHTGMSLHAYNFKSNFFRAFQQHWFAAIPVPLPQSFIDTFDLTQYERESFAGTAQNYLVGQLRFKQGFWNYYLVCWAVKTPIVSQFLILFSIIAGLWTKQFRKVLVFFCLLPVIIILIFLSSSSVQSGYRYLLPVLSLSIIAAAVLIQRVIDRVPKYFRVLLFTAMLFPALFSFPNYLTYTSEWLWPKRNAYLYLADSNLNWGQRQKQVKRYLQQHPEYIFDPATPTTGIILVDINKLTGTIETERFDWLRKNFKPMGTLDNCYLIYDVKKLP